MNQRTVVILLSDKRSGSTMIQRELCKHPDIQTVAYSPHTYFETHHWLKGAVLLGRAPETFAGHKVYAGYGSRANARTYLIDCVKTNVPEFQVPEDDRRLVFAGECGEFIEDRPEPFGLRFSDAQHLHRIGIQVSCEVACGFAVREHVEVLPEQLLDQ